MCAPMKNKNYDSHVMRAIQMLWYCYDVVTLETQVPPTELLTFVDQLKTITSGFFTLSKKKIVITSQRDHCTRRGGDYIRW